MDASQLELRWRSIRSLGKGPYDSLRISKDCIPELFLGLDINQHRNLLLHVPDGTNVTCPTVEREHLHIEWHPATRFIVLSLNTATFEDLFNELTVSMHERMKDLADPNIYTTEFLFCFSRWADFFDTGTSTILSESAIKGVFGELVLLNWHLENDTKNNLDSIFRAWQGPFDRSHDFIFDSINVEVKTKEIDQTYIHISSEFQLQPEMGKQLDLALIDVFRHADGLNIQEVITRIRNKALEQGIDLSSFAKALTKAGVSGGNTKNYEDLRWKVAKITLFDCLIPGFPAIKAHLLPLGIRFVRYDLNVTTIAPFAKRQIDFEWT